MAAGGEAAPAPGGERVTLNDGRVMPLVGLGTWKSKPGEVKAAVLAAVRAGYRHIDCAYIYKNEDEVGAALKELIAEGITREELWITSKLWNDSHKAEDVPTACAKTLSDLGLDYLDLYLVHWPVVTDCVGDVLNPSMEETWGAMEKLQADGLARSIGVSNFSAKKLADMKTYAKVFPAVNQVELHPIWRQDALLASASELGCHLTAFSPLGSPDSASMIGHDGASVLDNEVVKRIAEETGKSAGQVVLRWAVQRGTSIVPKSVTPSRIESNIDLFSWTLSEEQMSAIAGLEQHRLVEGKFWLKEDGPYKTVADLWDE